MSANNDDSGSARSKIVRSFKVMDVLRGANELQERLNKEYEEKKELGTEGDGPEKVFHLEVGQPESGAPRTVASSAIEALTMPRAKENVMGYTDAFGLMALRQKNQAALYRKVSIQSIASPRCFADCGDDGKLRCLFAGLYGLFRPKRHGRDCLVGISVLSKHFAGAGVFDCHGGDQRRIQNNFGGTRKRD
mmetsp:Transcript_8916/g.22016  ORF Transcript_8916/g.22016 Transcript_8916/m.22016 type:complete len:191 (+) Transcript_8916:132-704(+)